MPFKNTLTAIRAFLRENPNNKTYVLFIFVISFLGYFYYDIRTENKQLHERINYNIIKSRHRLDSIRFIMAKETQEAVIRAFECERESKEDFKELSKSYIELFYLNKQK